ncbi:MAG: beta-xylosidase [Chloroflexi bacterium]|nr:beta-xylosidase [Chloroflexota bacterium]
MIEAVMLWNEPNNLSHWDRAQDEDWSQFSEMTRLAGERVRRIAPGLTRVLGGISPIDPRFVQNVFGRGVDDAVDVVAVHGFPLDWNRWHLAEWPRRVQAVRDVAGGKPVWATEVGASSIASDTLQAWAVDAMLEHLSCSAERVFWYALMDLPERWEAVTRHRGSEGMAYFRHFRMGVFDAMGQPKPAAARLARWVSRGTGVCEWVYWREEARFVEMLRVLETLGVRRLRTGIGWADWDRPGAEGWFDSVMQRLEPYDVTLTLCFTPARAARVPHHTSPPVHLEDFADFCETMVRRYANLSPAIGARRLDRTCDDLSGVVASLEDPSGP